jgi:hypothetical protein
MVIQHSAQTLRKRSLLTRAWAVAVIVWSVARTIIIWAALGRYGFNPWIYLCLDLVCSAIDGYTTPKMVLRFIDDRYRSAVKWGIPTLVGYIVPDIYIFEGTRTLPLKVVVVLCTVIVAFMALAVIAIVRKVQLGRAARLLQRESIAARGRA